ncbi:MBOAT family O-acyltransferase [Campylobacter sp. RM16192]|uniref:MBOAT family O-acyltransferase n=1 Tax=Campylobacter sp. RM16192 TaxID=1660080 RepID=UPI001451A1EF|nr:MBOAT family O-acyltransferase [Campylobacter sp. RM16192]QCD51896.1 membrane bound O-acyl transferase, MBOAT family [Campylobacter sp. RM16192]
MNLFSIEFAVSFFIFWLFYYFFNSNIKAQKWLILGFSYLFLGLAGLKFLIINIIFSLIIYKFAKKIYDTNSSSSLFLGIVFVVLTLAFFKYNGFFELNFGTIKFENIALPLGVSFYSFMSIILLVDSYNQEIDKPNLLDTLLFLSFFAVIISGPILKPKPFFEKLNSKKEFSEESKIFTLLTLAIIKKLLIANHLFDIINPIFQAPNSLATSELIATLFGYSIMLYCDFSGYVDFVLALGLMCGFNLPTNFNRPFAALNLKEFWQNWHISLMNFFKNYIYIPLGGSRGGTLLTQINVLIVFFISGIWHGAGINFLIWGLMHGLGVIFLNLTKELDLLVFDCLKRFFTFVFVSFIWIFFVTDFIGMLRFLKAISTNLEGDRLNIIAVFAIAFLFTFIYSKINLKSLLFTFFQKINLFFSTIFLAIFGLIVYFLMPSGMPNFIYQGF